MAGTDYEAASGTLTFAAGETVHGVTVTVLADGVAEGDETLTLELSDPAGATLDDATATATITDSGEPAPAFEPLTASFTNVPSEQDGENAFSFEVAFSEDVAISYKTLRDESFTVTGGGTTGPVCTAGDDPRPLTNSLSVEVAGPPSAPLTASFGDMPAEHTGKRFTLVLTFSQDFGLSARTLRDEAFEVAGGTVRRARRWTQGSSQAWNIDVKPEGYGAVTIRLPATTDCGASGAICTGDGRSLSLSATVAGPVGVSVADARVEEDEGAVLAFAVTLSRAASGVLTVDYATADGSAQAGVDYTRAIGTLTFQAGESSKTIAVPAYAVDGDNLLSGTHRAAANDIMEMLGEPRRIPVIDVDDYPDGAEDLRALAEYGSMDYSGDELRAILAPVGAE